ncbi:hypothetical protein KAZ57_02970, partial [Patescibacteria group bacterium]|nr:hypothetical protein [Patescibacteria group bacterium]
MPRVKNSTCTVSLIACVFSMLLLSPTAFADITAPVTTATKTPTNPDGNNGWYKTPLQIKLDATDLESGVRTINYKIDTGAWQTVSFPDSLNLAPNPSFETPNYSNATGIQDWEATTQDAQTTYSRDNTYYLTGFDNSSAKITTTGIGWHGVNNKTIFASAAPYENMTASVWLKTNSVTGTAGFKVYAVSQDSFGTITYSLITQSSTITATTDWTNLSTNFVVNSATAIGVYIDIGIEGTGTIWADAASISQALTAATTTVTISQDSANHTFEYYSVDTAGNTEAHACPATKCITFKLDTTPPGNWNNSGAFRGLFGSSHELYVYTNVQDATSGISIFTDKYQYKTDNNTTFGKYPSLSSCNGTWQPNVWTILITPPFQNGVSSAYLLTPKTDFCNSDWKVCKYVRFFAQDMAGNTDTKDYCINGPWIKIRGEGIVRSNTDINMLSDTDEDNTDSLIETGQNGVEFFDSSRDWEVSYSPTPTTHNYDEMWGLTLSKTTISSLNSSSGLYYINGNHTVTNANLPNNYNTATFNQIVFINGDLTISRNIDTAAASTALYVVKGDVFVDKDVENLEAAVIANGEFHSAYNLAEDSATKTLNLNGFYNAQKFYLQRTLQGTNNEDLASENFVYEPKYLIQLS